MKRRRDPLTREALIALGHQALKEGQHGTSEASYVFEDAWREATPLEVHHFADNLHSVLEKSGNWIYSVHGYFQERAALDRMLLWLEDAPVREAAERAEPRVAKVLSRAWKSNLIVRADEEDMPILRHLPQHIRAGVQYTQEGYSRPYVRTFIKERSFRLPPRAPAALSRLAERVADIIYEEGKRT